MDMEHRSLKNFILGTMDQLKNKVTHAFSPVFQVDEKDDFTLAMRSCVREGLKKPYQAQEDILCAVAKGFRSKKVIGLIAEMGCGKTLLGTLSAWALARQFGRPIRTLVLCPPHLISTWQKEIKDILPDVTIVNAGGKDALSLLVELRSQPKRPAKNEFWIMGFNRAKTNFQWQRTRDVKRSKHGANIAIEICGKCSRELPLDVFQKKQRYSCPYCGNPLWGPKNASSAYAPVLFIKKYLAQHFELFIADEVHKLKGAGTIQGAMLGQLASCIRKTLLLTGTLSGGKASDVYYLLQRGLALNYSEDERRRILPAYSEVLDFVKTYGSVEEVRKHSTYDHATGRSTRERYSIKEKPGISPMLLKQFFLENCVFMRISDITDALPAYTEVIEYTDLHHSMKEVYAKFERNLKNAALKAIASKDMTVLGQMLSTLLAWPDQPQQGAVVHDSYGLVAAEVEGVNLPLTPKDERLIECVLEAREKGRKSLIFVEYTGKWSADTHVATLLQGAGIKALVLKASVPTDKRLDWIEKNMATGKYDCLICQPRLVETGLNLLMFPQILFWQTGFSTYGLRQASRRSWRPGQTQDVVVRFFINRETMQERAMTLIASKLEASLVLEGELSDKGLVAVSEVGDSMTVELARSLVGHLKLQSLESQFAAYRQSDVTVRRRSLAVASAKNVPPSPKGKALKPVVKQPIEKPLPSPKKGKAFGRCIGSLSGTVGCLSGTIRKMKVTAHRQPCGRMEVLLHGNMPVGFIENGELAFDEGFYPFKEKLVVTCEAALPGFEVLNVHVVSA